MVKCPKCGNKLTSFKCDKCDTDWSKESFLSCSNPNSQEIKEFADFLFTSITSNLDVQTEPIENDTQEIAGQSAEQQIEDTEEKQQIDQTEEKPKDQSAQGDIKIKPFVQKSTIIQIIFSVIGFLISILAVVFQFHRFQQNDINQFRIIEFSFYSIIGCSIYFLAFLFFVKKKHLKWFEIIFVILNSFVLFYTIGYGIFIKFFMNSTVQDDGNVFLDQKWGMIAIYLLPFVLLIQCFFYFSINIKLDSYKKVPIFIAAFTLCFAAATVLSSYYYSENRFYKIGDIVEIGSYEQDQYSEDVWEPIEWEILSLSSDGTALVVTRDCLDVLQYNTNENQNDWEKSVLKTYADAVFYPLSFDDEEKDLIMISEYMGKNERVFIPTRKMCYQQYNSSNAYSIQLSRTASNTYWELIESDDSVYPNFEKASSTCFWYKPEPNDDKGTAFFVDSNGEPLEGLCRADYYAGVKYAMYVDMNKYSKKRNLLSIHSRKNGEKKWSSVLSADVGEVLEMQIEYTNKEINPVYDAMVRVWLPDNMEYVKDSTVIYNIKFKDGATIDQNTLCTEGINIGNYGPNVPTYIRFKAIVTDKSLEDKDNLLYTWVNVTVDGEVVARTKDIVSVKKE